VGLKQGVDCNLQIYTERSNRTIVGLKHAKDKHRRERKRGSNRTIVGLKPGETGSSSIVSPAAIAPLWD